MPAVTARLRQAAATTDYAVADYAVSAIRAIAAAAEDTLHVVVASCMRRFAARPPR